MWNRVKDPHLLTQSPETFYNYENDTMLEPELPGISYSFTSDGHWEEALYRAIANRASLQHTLHT